MELLLFPNCVMYYRKRAFSAAQVGVQMEKILLHPIKGQLRPIRGALQGRGIRGDHLAGKMQKFRRQHGVVDLRNRLPLRRSRPSLYQGVKQQRQQPLLCPDKFRQPGPSPAGLHRSYTPLRRHGAGKIVPFGSLHPAPAPLGRKPKSAAPRSKMPGNGRWRGSSETGRGQYPAHPDPPPPRGTGQNAARCR